jgi:hypothetical protein
VDPYRTAWRQVAEENAHILFLQHPFNIIVPSTSRFINPFYQSVSVCVSIVARQRLGKNFSAVKNTHATTEELCDALFSMLFVT